jgi:beta-alanine--pyruvate transaminase
MFAALDVKVDQAPGKRGHAMQKKLFDNGLHVKATGDSLLVAPPLIAERAHIDAIAEILRKSLASL